jgi:hypothetical protein
VIVDSSTKGIVGFAVLGKPNIDVFSKESGGVQFSTDGEVEKVVYGLGGVALRKDPAWIVIGGATIGLKEHTLTIDLPRASSVPA